MFSERELELMNRAMDNDLSVEEQKEFALYLQNNSELKHRYEEIKKSTELIRNLPEYTPSENIKKNILNTIGITQIQTPVKESTPSIFSILWQPKFRFVLGFSLLVVLVSVFIYYTTDQSITNQQSISGYMGRMESMLGNYDQIYSTDLVGIKSSLSIFQYSDTLIVEMNKKSADKIFIGYHFKPDSVSFIGVREFNPTFPFINKMDGKTSISVTDSTRIFMMFHILKPESEIDVQVRNIDRQIFRYKFTADLKN